MNILMMVSTNIPPCEGVSYHTLEISKLLRNNGHNITLMTRGLWNNTNEVTFEGFRVIKIRSIPFYPLRILSDGYFFRKALSELKPQPDLIHVHTPLMPPLKTNLPIIATVHGTIKSSIAQRLSPEAGLRKILSQIASSINEVPLLQESGYLIAVNNSIKEDLVSLYNISPERISVIQNAVDTEFFEPGAGSAEDNCLVYVGRFARQKGLFEVVRSAREVTKAHPEIKYILVGDGSIKAELQSEIRNLGLEPFFEFPGTIYDRRELLKIYQKASIVLNPSYSETGPLTLLEAMACGKPIITTNTGLAQIYVNDLENGIKIAAKSVDELTSATIKMLSSSELRNKLGVAARKTALEQFDIQKNIDGIEELYQKTMISCPGD
jgi:glycosyltransferase involved in cell wall biosynthesis